MADQPQTPNAARISAMLQDLAAQKSDTPTSAPQTAAPRPVVPMAPPSNLPTAPARPAPAPMPSVTLTPPARPVAPPPAPVEPAVRIVPIARPPVPPAPPAPAPAPVAPIPPPTIAPVPPPQKPASAEVSTELRTMSADIGNLRVGQAPQGIRPPSAMPAAPTPITAPTAPVVPPTVSEPSPMSTVAVPPPIMAPTPSRPAAIAPPTITAPTSPGSGSGFFTKVIYGVLAVLILAGIAYGALSLMSGSTPEPIASVTPTPNETTSPTPSLKTLESYVGQRSGMLQLNDLFMMDATKTESFRSSLISLMPAAKTAKNVLITGAGKAGDVLDQFGTYWVGEAGPARPSQTALGEEYAFLIFGQSETFDAQGLPVANAAVQPRVAAIFELTDASAIRQAMQEWESGDGIVRDLQYLFDFDPSMSIVASFSDGLYRQIPVRYRNFTYADRSIDWSIMLASNGKNYLVLSSSRESLFFIIDTLMR